VRRSTAEPVAFARRLGNDLARGEPRATHRRLKRRYKKRMRMPSKLDPHVALIESWCQRHFESDPGLAISAL
jgi:hypothetical protein